MIGDQEARLAETAHGGAEEDEHVRRLRRVAVDAKRQQLARVAVEEHGDVEAHPEEVDGRQVKMPRAVGVLRTQDVERDNWFGRRDRGRWRPGWFGFA